MSEFGKPGFHCGTCNQAMEQLDPYVDRELTDTEMVEVRRHLAGCPPCEQRFIVQEKLKMLVYRKACPERAPAALLSRVLKALK